MPMEFFKAISTELSLGINMLVASCCGIYIILILLSSETAGDRRILRTVLAYLCDFIVAGFILVLYRLNPQLYATLSPLLLLSLILWPVLIYKMVYEITGDYSGQRFPLIHFIIPVLITLLWVVITHWLPPEVRVDIIRRFAKPATDYEVLSYYFTSIGLHLLLYSIPYITFSLVLLIRYRKQRLADNKPDSRYKLGWLLAIVAIFAVYMLLIGGAVAMNDGRLKLFSRLWCDLFTSAIFISSMLILTVNIIRCNYPPRRISTRTVQWVGSATGPLPSAKDMVAELNELGMKPRMHHRTANVEKKHPVLNKKHIESLMRTEKLYLDSAITLVGLARKLGTNRVALSAFINSAYGINFNVWLNGWRLREAERLCGLKRNYGKPMSEISKQAGFGSYDSYRRAIAAERVGKSDAKRKGGRR